MLLTLTRWGADQKKIMNYRYFSVRASELDVLNIKLIFFIWSRKNFDAADMVSNVFPNLFEKHLNNEGNIILNMNIVF